MATIADLIERDNRELLMPTVLVDGTLAFVFFSSDHGEPLHIHVQRDRLIAKIWLDPVRVATNRGFPQHGLNEIMQRVTRHEATIREAWNDYFGA